MTRLLLLRHGQTHSNVAGSLDTAIPGADLTPLGVRQAEAAATNLADTPVDTLVVSRLVRTHQTASPLAAVRRMTPTVAPGLEEIGAGALEARTDEESHTQWIRVLSGWFRDELDLRMPGGETGWEFLARYDAALAPILGAVPADAAVLAVSHGAAIRLWSWQRVADRSRLPALDQRIDNTGMISLDLPVDTDPASASWQVASAHLEPLGGDLLSDHSEHDPTGDPL